MENLDKFLIEVQNNLKEELGDGFFRSAICRESSWIFWNKKRIEEGYTKQFWMFTPINKDYILSLGILGDNSVSLQYLEVFEEGKGIGTKIVNCVLDAADSCGISIDVFASPFKVQFSNVPVNQLKKYQISHMTKEVYRLIDWYRGFNFISLDKKRPYKLNYKPQLAS
tara:strand:+ start:756 stop:1259 length:504 start_codon:yes stop_codon:yes gene_type:complete